MKLSVSVDSTEARRLFDAAPQGLARAIQDWLSKGSQLVVGEMRGLIQERVKNPRTGQLAGGVQAHVHGLVADIGPNVDYAEFVDQPTRAHVIEPRFKKALAFPLAGGVRSVNRAGHVSTVFRFGGKTVRRGAVFARRVQHPGTKGLFFLRDTALRVQEPLKKLFDDLVQRELDKLTGGP